MPRRHAAAILAIIGLPIIGLSGAAAAQASKVLIPSDATQDLAGSALVEAFALFCLDRFPDAARVEDAAPGRMTAMPRAQVQRYLHADPGRGWTYRTDDGAYVLTIEDPP